MPEYLDVGPEVLRKVANQHSLVAANIRKWGEIPHAWLADFEPTYGTLADPVRAALVDYYDRRHGAAERLAANHERARDELMAAARSFEDTDHTVGRQIAQVGGIDALASLVGPTPRAPTDPAAPEDASPNTPRVNGTQPGPPSATMPSAPRIVGLGMVADGTGRSGQAPLPPAASAPQTYDTAPAGATAPTGTTPPSVGIPEPGAADVPVAPAVDANRAAGMAGGMSAPLATGPFAAAVVARGAGMAGGIPAPLATGPFAAAVHAAKDRQALPSFVVGEQVEEDLALARTLLAATLAAVADSTLGLEWAVAVGRTPVGPIVLLTSTEGRGWLPPGLFLPSEVILPWRWDFVLDTAAREAIAALEGTTDPARILAEFGLMGPRRMSVRISALVSSAAIPDNLRAALGDDVALEDRVFAAESAVDLTSPGVGLVDRLALASSDELLRQAATVPETEIPAKCLELARAADARVRTAVTGIDGGISAHRARRQRILDALHVGRPIPTSWWDQIRAADDMTATTQQSRRVDVSHVPAGGVRPDLSGTEAVRGMVFERRADELLLLLAAGEPDRQTLRDVLYTYGQITEHPLLPAAALRVVATETTGAGTVVPDVEVARSVGPGSHGAGSIGLGGAPRFIAESLKGLAGSEGSGEQRGA